MQLPLPIELLSKVWAVMSDSAKAKLALTSKKLHNDGKWKLYRQAVKCFRMTLQQQRCINASVARINELARAPVPAVEVKDTWKLDQVALKITKILHTFEAKRERSDAIAESRKMLYVAMLKCKEALLELRESSWTLDPEVQRAIEKTSQKIESLVSNNSLVPV